MAWFTDGNRLGRITGDRAKLLALPHPAGVPGSPATALAAVGHHLWVGAAGYIEILTVGDGRITGHELRWTGQSDGLPLQLGPMTAGPGGAVWATDLPFGSGLHRFAVGGRPGDVLAVRDGRNRVRVGTLGSGGRVRWRSLPGTVTQTPSLTVAGGRWLVADMRAGHRAVPEIRSPGTGWHAGWPAQPGETCGHPALTAYDGFVLATCVLHVSRPQEHDHTGDSYTYEATVGPNGPPRFTSPADPADSGSATSGVVRDPLDQEFAVYRTRHGLAVINDANTDAPAQTLPIPCSSQPSTTSVAGVAYLACTTRSHRLAWTTVKASSDKGRLVTGRLRYAGDGYVGTVGLAPRPSGTVEFYLQGPRHGIFVRALSGRRLSGARRLNGSAYGGIAASGQG